MALGERSIFWLLWKGERRHRRSSRDETCKQLDISGIPGYVIFWAGTAKGGSLGVGLSLLEVLAGRCYDRLMSVHLKREVKTKAMRIVVAFTPTESADGADKSQRPLLQ